MSSKELMCFAAYKNEKKPKKKYQQFKTNKERDSTISVGKVIDPLLRNDIAGKSSSGFVDWKDFPELKVSSKQDKIILEKPSSLSSFKGDKSWLSVVIPGNQNKLNTAFPPLPTAENLKKDKIGVTIRNDIVQQHVIKDISADVVGREDKQNANQKQNKGGLKNTPEQPQRNPNKKKRSDPIFINIQEILLTNKPQKKIKQHNLVGNKTQRLRDKELLSGNFLDSSNPKRSRGKHREIKKEKLTNLKTMIIKERIIKSKMKEETVSTDFASSSVNFLDKIDFHEEIKIYLNELNNKKLQNSERKQNKLKENTNAGKIIKEKQENIIAEINEKRVENLENAVPHLKVKQIPQTTAEGEIKFSSKFREYCDNVITPDLNSCVSKFIEELINLQDRLFSRDPIKAKSKKRHVSGIREVRKYLTLKKVKMIIIAPNLEKLQMEGSVYDLINDLKSMADSQNVPYGFALDRYKLGKCTKKNVPVSAFAVMNYEGIEALYENTLHQLMEAKRKFAEMAKPNVVLAVEDVNSKLLSTLVSAVEEALKVSDEAPPDTD